MDKLVRKIEIPLAKKAIEKEGLYIVGEKDIDRLAEVAADAYRDYPLHNWFTKGKYDPKASKLIMQISLKTMTEDAVIYADSEEINGFAAWLPFGFTGNKAIPFLLSGGLKLILHSGLGIISRLSAYESYAMELKKEYTDHYDSQYPDCTSSVSSDSVFSDSLCSALHGRYLFRSVLSVLQFLEHSELGAPCPWVCLSLFFRR